MVLNIIIAVLSIILIVGVFIYSHYKYKDEKRPKMNFIRELFNHFGDTWNMKR